MTAVLTKTRTVSQLMGMRFGFFVYANCRFVHGRYTAGGTPQKMSVITSTAKQSGRERSRPFPTLPAGKDAGIVAPYKNMPVITSAAKQSGRERSRPFRLLGSRTLQKHARHYKRSEAIQTQKLTLRSVRRRGTGVAPYKNIPVILSTAKNPSFQDPSLRSG